MKLYPVAVEVSTDLYNNNDKEKSTSLSTTGIESRNAYIPLHCRRKIHNLNVRTIVRLLPDRKVGRLNVTVDNIVLVDPLQRLTHPDRDGKEGRKGHAGLWNQRGSLILVFRVR